MAFDGLVTKSVVDELNRFILNGKVNKVFEPNKNEIILGVYAGGKNYALDCCIGVDNYRMSLTTSAKPNPLNAPGFCMLLRKHLVGGRIKKISSAGLERVITIEFECYNEMNDLVIKKLVVELMGKHSNIILLNDKDFIIDSLRHLDASCGSIRDILPAHPYVVPENDKVDFLNVKNFDEFYSYLNAAEPLDMAISNVFIGISKASVKCIMDELGISNFSKDNALTVYKYLVNCLNNSIYLKCYNKDYALTLQKPCMEMLQDSSAVAFENFANKVIENEIKSVEASLPYLNFFLDDFYTFKEDNNDFVSYRNSVLKLLSGTLKKITKRLNNINAKLKECEDKDIYKLYGELITGNMYRFKDFSSDFIEVENYYDDNKLVKIPVNSHLSPSANAKNYFKKYNKLKNALEVVNKQKDDTIKELDYIESIIFSLDNSKTVSDIDEIYSEIKENDLFDNRKSKLLQYSGNGAVLHSSSKSPKASKVKNINKKVDKKDFAVLTYKIGDFTFLVGKNNKQNDYLSTKVLKNTDIWFHTKDIHGSHGVLQTGGKMLLNFERWWLKYWRYN